MSVPDISMEVEKKVTAIGSEMKARAVRGSRALKNAELNVLRGQRGGRVYKKAFKKSRYTASAPGEPPAVRSGKLRRSFRPASRTYDNPFGGAASVTISIETDTHYAGYLEDGTSKMAARPYVEQIKQEALPEITRIYGAPYNV
jgi:HK97 gp10 family phage protein